MKYLPVLFSILFLGLSSCTKSPETKNKVDSTADAGTVDGFYVDGDSLVLPEITVRVELSDKAEKKLKKENETIVIQAYLNGVPKPDSEIQPDEMGELNLGSPHIELGQPGSGTFTDVKISKTAYESLADKDFQVLINVFSGRHSSELNLLDCEIVQEPISKVKGKKLLIRGKLIGE